MTVQSLQSCVESFQSRVDTYLRNLPDQGYEKKKQYSFRHPRSRQLASHSHKRTQKSPIPNNSYQSKLKQIARVSLSLQLALFLKFLFLYFKIPSLFLIFNARAGCKTKITDIFSIDVTIVNIFIYHTHTYIARKEKDGKEGGKKTRMRERMRESRLVCLYKLVLGLACYSLEIYEPTPHP